MEVCLVLCAYGLVISAFTAFAMKCYDWIKYGMNKKHSERRNNNV